MVLDTRKKKGRSELLMAHYNRKGTMKMNMKWKDMTTMQKIGFIITCLGAVLVAVAMMKPELFPVSMTTPGIAVMSVGEAMDYWKKDRKWALLFIGAAVISMACFVLELCLL